MPNPETTTASPPQPKPRERYGPWPPEQWGANEATPEQFAEYRRKNPLPTPEEHAAGVERIIQSLATPAMPQPIEHRSAPPLAASGYQNVGAELKPSITGEATVTDARPSGSTYTAAQLPPTPKNITIGQTTAKSDQALNEKKPARKHGSQNQPRDKGKFTSPRKMAEDKAAYEAAHAALKKEIWRDDVKDTLLITSGIALFLWIVAFGIGGAAAVEIALGILHKAAE